MTEMLPENSATGPTVTEIVPKPSDPNFRIVVVGGRTIAALRAVDIEALGIRAGTRWSPRLQQAVRDMVELDKTRKAALVILGRRALSRSRLIERLVRKGHSAAHAQRTAHELTADGWLDDARLAETLLRQMQLKRPIGPALALQKLESQGIDAEVAGPIVRDAMSGVDPVAAAVALARQKMKSAVAGGGHAAARRVAGALARRGFDEDTILAALDQLGTRGDDPADIDEARKETAS